MQKKELSHRRACGHEGSATPWPYERKRGSAVESFHVFVHLATCLNHFSSLCNVMIGNGDTYTCTHGVEGMSLLIDCFELKAVEEESKCEKITRAFLLESRKLSSYRRDVLCVSVGDCPCFVSSRMRHVWCPVCPQCRLGPSSKSGSGAVFLSGDSPWSKWSLLLVSMSSWRLWRVGRGVSLPGFGSLCLLWKA